MLKRGETLKNQAYELLRSKILHQEFSMGQRLNLAALSRDLQVSNSPLRESLALLEQGGIVESLPNAGFRVSEWTAERMTALTQVLLVLLDGCYMDCVRNGRTKELAARMEEAFARQRAAFTGEATFDYAELAIDFDRCFVQVCRNQMLSDMFDCKFDMLMMATLFIYRNDSEGVEENLKEHELILQAVKQDDVELTRRRLEIHYNKAEIIQTILAK